MPRSEVRLLCDQNVAQQYVDGFRARAEFQVTRVEEVLDVRALDGRTPTEEMLN